MKTEKACIILSSISMLFSLLAMIVIRCKPAINQVITIPTEEHSVMSNYHQAYLEHTKLRVMMASVDAKIEKSEGTFEEEPSEEMNCLFYATVPIGKYYITAYNHKETGSKITASGTTCHEGTITTCAADVPKYFRFGDYVEIMVDGEARLYKIEDTGSAVKKKHIDIYFYDYSKMSRYGSNYQNISKVEFPFGKPKEA